MADWYKASLGGLSRPTLGDDLEQDDLQFVSRRSPIVCRNACVASSQPLASSIGLDLLRRGANAAETAIGMAAVLAVTEPCSTGLGGDMFCLYYENSTRKVSAINGSGRSPRGLSLDELTALYPASSGDGIDAAKFRDSPHSVTVPGAARGWEDLYKRHGSGKLSLADLLEPAAVLAEDGFPVAPVTSYHWRAGLKQISKWLSAHELSSVPLTVDGKRAPNAGEVVRNPDMARVLRDLGRLGATDGYYCAQTGRAIADVVQKHGGCLTMDDLRAHSTSEFPDPISVDYRGCKLWQVPPNGQGIAGLIALSGLDSLEKAGSIRELTKDSIGADYCYHAMIEMMRLGFADARAHVADPSHMNVTVPWLLDSDRIRKRAVEMFDPFEAKIHGVPDASSCTVSFQAVDAEGNAISFVNSNYMGFGTGIVPKDCGFTLQNRGFGFTLAREHDNCVGPGKRPYHTIIPAMLTHTDTNELYATLSNMGGNMQPQGHLQLTVDLLAGGLDPQAAIDTPRFCIVDGTQGGDVFLEAGIDPIALTSLKEKGHPMRGNVKGHERSMFGKAQIIKKDRITGVLWAGSDGRADGCAIGY